MFDTVGAMYVRVLSDTSGLKGELERDFGKQGAVAADAFGKPFDKQLSKNINKMRAFDVLDARLKTWARDFSKTIGDSLDVEPKVRIGDIISAAEINELSERMKIPARELATYLKKAIPDALRAAEKEQRDSIKRLGELREQEAAEERKRIKSLADYDRVTWAKSMKARLDETERLIEETYRTLNKENTKFQKDHDASWRRILTNIDLFGGKVKKVTLALRRTGTGGAYDTLTNVLAGMLGTAFKVGSVVPKILTKVGGAFTDLGVKMMSTGGQVGQLGTVFASLGKVLGKAGPYGAVIALVAALGLLQSMLGSLSVLVSTFAAGIVALGSALFYAVSNAALLVPVLGAIGVGFAGAAIGAIDATQAIGKLWKAVNETDPKAKAEAWKDYNRELKKLGPNARAAVSAMKPLVEEFSGLKRTAGEALFDGMADALKKATPLIDALKTGLTNVAGAVGDVVEGFLALAQNQTFMASFTKMWELSATIIRDLGSVASNLFAGFTNFFSAISPLVEKFTGGLATAAENFRKWTETEGGRQAILQFFTDAYDIGSQVWAVVKELALALFDLFTADATKGAAKDLFGFLLEEVQKFRDWINEVSENGKLQKWFDDAKVVGKALWAVVKDLAALFGSLNNDTNRGFFLFLLDVVRVIIATFRVLFTVGRWALAGISAALTPVKIGFNALKTAIGYVIDKVRDLIAWIKRIPVVGRIFGGGERVSGGGSFRAMSAMDTQVGPTGSLVVNNWNITTPGMDSRVVASQVMNRMAAMAG
jgi:hypothetical protein